MKGAINQFEIATDVFEIYYLPQDTSMDNHAVLHSTEKNIIYKTNTNGPYEGYNWIQVC